jgi:hypothetical protein
MARRMVASLAHQNSNLRFNTYVSYKIGRQQCMCTISFLDASLLEKLDFWFCLGGVSTAATYGMAHSSGAFL